MEVYGYLYKITIDNPKSSLHGKFYIGQKKGLPSDSKNLRYWGSGRIIWNYARKNGLGQPNRTELYLSKEKAERLGLEREIISLHYSKDELNTAEYDEIGFHFGQKDCLNISVGGKVYENNPDSIRIKVMKYWTEENRRRHSLVLSGKIISDEVKARMSEGQKKAWTEERRKRAAENLKGHEVSEECREKISKANKGRKMKGKALENIRNNNRKAIGTRWYTDGIVYKRFLPGEEPKGFYLESPLKKRYKQN